MSKYKCINGWTKDKMIEHIKKEFKGKSVDAANCWYRGAQDKKCAIGMFIPDSEYDVSMDENAKGYLTLIKEFPNLEKYMPLEKDGCKDFQHKHDWSNESKTLEILINFIETEVTDE